MLRRVHIEGFETVLGQPQFLHHRRGSESQMVAVADVDRRTTERFARSGPADRRPGLDEQWLISVMHTEADAMRYADVFAEFVDELIA